MARILETGDTELFGIIYDRYANKVYRKCLSVIKESDTAQDLVHDILVKVFVSLPTFKGQSKLGSWIYAITYNPCWSSWWPPPRPWAGRWSPRNWPSSWASCPRR